MSQLLVRLDNWSDRLSPMVVKEVRQLVRGKEFTYSFGLALIAGLMVAFFGLASATDISGGYGAQIFSALMVCLMLLGLVVVPLGAFNALRTERSDQTLDLITQTALSPRRIVIGKLLAQGVKLVILFAGLGPFVTMSFLLGGIDLTSILVALAVLFLWSMWVAALCLFVSAASASRAVSGVLFIILTIGFLMLMARFSYVWMPLLGFPGFPGISSGGLSIWWLAALSTAFCLISMGNFVLLAENRLSIPIEDRSTALRVGFFVQFLFILGCIVGPLVAKAAGATTTTATASLGVLGGLQIALVSIFATTEGMFLSRRVIRNIKASLKRPWFAVFRPGGGRAAQWILLQMILLLLVGAWLTPLSSSDFRWLLAICGYICFFSGVPAYIGRSILKARARASQLRVVSLIFFPVVMISADVLQYFFKTTAVVQGTYSRYHVLNPFRTLGNWPEIENIGWDVYAYLMGFIGLVCFVMLIRIGRRETRNASILHTSN